MNQLSVFDKHQLAIARKTLQMTCAGCLIMGGMNHSQAVKFFHRIGWIVIRRPDDCICPKE